MTELDNFRQDEETQLLRRKPIQTFNRKCLGAVFAVMATISLVIGIGVAVSEKGGSTGSSEEYPLPCTSSPSMNLPFCNISLPVSVRVQDLISRLSISDKINQFSKWGYASEIKSLKLPGYYWWSEALHGIAESPGIIFKHPTPYATSFPQIIGMGATFDIPLVYKMAETISTEARAFANAGHGGLTFWAPTMNIFRDPRWGRGQETPGEDPFTTSQYVEAFVTGMQGGQDPNYLKVSACCKHYAAYSLEDSDGIDRFHFNGIVTDQDWADTYLPAFQTCVERGKASAIMCAYNANNGIPSCADPHLLTDILKTQWGFEGYITGDCGAVKWIMQAHNYTNTTQDTCAVALNAGVDMDCGTFLISYLTDALGNKTLTEADLDDHLTNLFTVQMRLGYYDPPNMQPYRQISHSAINTQDAQQLALRAARESIVLLKNENMALPFSRTKIKSIALIGPNAAATTTMLGNYYGPPPYMISPLMGLEEYASVQYQKGCDIASSDTSKFTAAINAAKEADATVLVMGLDQTQEAEWLDRVTIDFPGVQSNLIQQVAAAAKGPVILVLMSGSSVDLTYAKASQDIDGILWVGYPGQSGGDAIAQVIFGDYNPGGRLPITFHDKNFINQVSMLDMGMRPNSTVNIGRTYRFFTGIPVYPFGSGLSYTTFSYQWLNTTSSKLTMRASDFEDIPAALSLMASQRSSIASVVSVNVTNTGLFAGDDVIIAYMVPPNAGMNGTPIRYVVGFQRVHLYPGQSQIVSFDISNQNLQVADVDGFFKTQIGEWRIHIGSNEDSILIV